MLGNDASELTQRVRNGERMAEIAAEVHVEEDDLRVALTDSVRETAPPVVAQRLIARLPQATFGSRPLQGTPSVTQQAKAVESLAARLELRAEDLHQSLEDGSFRQLLADSGVEARLGILVNKLL